VATLPDRTTAVPFRLCRMIRLSAVWRFPRPNATRLLSATARQLRTRCFTNNCCKMADDNKIIVAVKYERLGDVRARNHNITARRTRDKGYYFPEFPTSRRRPAIHKQSGNGMSTTPSCRAFPDSRPRFVLFLPNWGYDGHWALTHHSYTATGRSRTVHHNNIVNCCYDFRLLYYFIMVGTPNLIVYSCRPVYREKYHRIMIITIL